jgi:hypothetical protein
MPLLSNSASINGGLEGLQRPHSDSVEESVNGDLVVMEESFSAAVVRAKLGPKYIPVADRSFKQQLMSAEFVYIFTFTMVHLVRRQPCLRCHLPCHAAMLSYCHTVMLSCCQSCHAVMLSWVQ